MTEAKSKLPYAKRRADLEYYKVLKCILSCISKNAQSIIDIGSNGVDLISHLNVPIKVSLDKKNPVTKNGIISIKEDFLQYNMEFKYDIVCCFQVLEHVQEVNDFAQKLLQCAKIVVISVPYKCKWGRNSNHIHDPVDESKLFTWMQRTYDFSVTCVENNSYRRLIACYYQNNKEFIARTYSLCVPSPFTSIKSSTHDSQLNNDISDNEQKVRKRELQVHSEIEKIKNMKYRKLRHKLHELKKSFSWRITSPLRGVWKLIIKLKRFIN